MAARLPAGDENVWLGDFGEGWFRVLCTTTGCPAPKVQPDQVGTDFDVHDHDHEIIRVQVKTTESPLRTGDGYAYDLDVATYNRLRRGSAWGYLVLIVVHQAHPGWTSHHEVRSVVHAIAYWTRLAGMPETPNKATVRVSLPLGNMLTPDNLLDLFPKGGEEDGEPG